MAGLIDEDEYERLMMFGGEDDDLPVRISPMLDVVVVTSDGLMLCHKRRGPRVHPAPPPYTYEGESKRRMNYTQETTFTTVTRTWRTRQERPRFTDCLNPSRSRLLQAPVQRLPDVPGNGRPCGVPQSDK
eukprot:1193251-Prorocentrum_minimum.AAC.4